MPQTLPGAGIAVGDHVEVNWAVVVFYGANLALDPRNALRSLLVGMHRGDLGKQLRAPVSSKVRQSIADFAGIGPPRSAGWYRGTVEADNGDATFKVRWPDAKISSKVCASATRAALASCEGWSIARWHLACGLPRVVNTTRGSKHCGITLIVDLKKEFSWYRESLPEIDRLRLAHPTKGDLVRTEIRLDSGGRGYVWTTCMEEAEAARLRAEIRRGEGEPLTFIEVSV